MNDVNIPIDFTSFFTFSIEMFNVLKEKYPKYKDTWKYCDINYLFNQLEKYSNEIIDALAVFDLRKLIHLANYCYFLYSRLKELK